MVYLILLRHGESVWNKENVFTGWVDIPLSAKGRKEALNAGKKLKKFNLDIIFTSKLIRAQETLTLSLQDNRKIPWFQDAANKWNFYFGKHDLVPVIQAWQLNERFYGNLQGLNKDEMRKKYGADQVFLWRRSYDVKPPKGESLDDTATRTIPYFEKQIVPYLKKGKNVLIVAHGNSLRSIIMELDNLTGDEVAKLEVPTGIPIVYDFDSKLRIKGKKILK
ncbi:2,3-bisphosphoglycerate-dependent phosphoglycerate mutase [uncultured archaeon]|nr:2,3-bisphosphoglycerate-dependent phosphoglycerate mutase [uncultured archaeon]